MSLSSILCIMGPTAAGKTPLAIELAKRLPCEIISVDSAMVYKGMNIGTAKPESEILQQIPHHLIDIADPKDSYSAGQFRRDALKCIDAIHAKGKLPLLVGGTMMYFRILHQGLAELPTANAEVRAQLQHRAEQIGWEGLHAELATIDPQAAMRIHQRDTQRIQRALEVYMLTGKNISTWQQEETSALSHYHIDNIALAPTDRATLHQRIEVRFHQMMEQGFIKEVEALFSRGDLNADLPSIRSVGYRQAWAYLEGKLTLSEMTEKSIIATRQLAKRQLTWLRSWPKITWLDIESTDYLEKAYQIALSAAK